MDEPVRAAEDMLTEHCLGSEQVYRGNFLQVFRDEVRLPSGMTAHREYIKHPGAVVIVALHDDGRAIVERQYRYPMGRVMLEFPAGKLDGHEDPLACGQRELLEETGFTAREWAYAGAMHNAIAYSNEVIHIWFAQGLTAGHPQLDEGEFLEVDAMSPDQLLQATCDGRITDAKTLTALLWLQNVRSGLWPLSWQKA
jgi:ADP-ribose pyrophosphatase